MWRSCRWIAATVALAAAAIVGAEVLASSHREAPLISEDPYADNTDVYVFISPQNADNIVLVGNYVPLELPASGPNFYKFSDNVLYTIKIDNDGDAKEDVTFEFDFSTKIQNPDTFLYNLGPVTSPGDPNLNVQQTYDVRRRSGRRSEVIASGVPVAPWNVGDSTFPGGTYESIASSSVVTTTTGAQFFAGPRDDPFFVDLAVFDLLSPSGVSTTNGLNVMSIVVEVPITDLADGGVRPSAGSTGPESVLGVWAIASRNRKTIRSPRRGERHVGGFTQVSRLGLPLINEVVIPLQDKDNYNLSLPKRDLRDFRQYILFPELPGLLQDQLGADCLTTPSEGRTDLEELFAPRGTRFADLLRIDITEGQTYADSGFPNGRRLEDDVVDTLLSVLCGNGQTIGDGVSANDLPFSTTFPYLASPHSGNPLGSTPTVGRAVALDFDTGGFSAGTTICLDRVTSLGGCVGVGPECVSEADQRSHLHFTIFIDSGGPFSDPRDGAGCGHGQVQSNVSGCGPDFVPSCSGG